MAVKQKYHYNKLHFCGIQFSNFFDTLQNQKNCQLMKRQWNWNITTKSDLFEFLQKMIFSFFLDTSKKTISDYFGNDVLIFSDGERIGILSSWVHKNRGRVLQSLEHGKVDFMKSFGAGLIEIILP